MIFEVRRICAPRQQPPFRRTLAAAGLDRSGFRSPSPNLRRDSAKVSYPLRLPPAFLPVYRLEKRTFRVLHRPSRRVHFLKTISDQALRLSRKLRLEDNSQEPSHVPETRSKSRFSPRLQRVGDLPRRTVQLSLNRPPRSFAEAKKRIFPTQGCCLEPSVCLRSFPPQFPAVLALLQWFSRDRLPNLEKTSLISPHRCSGFRLGFESSDPRSPSSGVPFSHCLNASHLKPKPYLCSRSIEAISLPSHSLSPF
jgi:hypothetical protein